VKVSLIVTLLNEADTVEGLLQAIQSQTRAPDEVVFVDGGSTDGTLELLERWAGSRTGVTVKSLPGTNIAAGRNAAVELAAGPVIAVTDAGCTPEPEWLERLTEPFGRKDLDMVMGFYRPDPRSRFERIVGCLNLPDAAEIDPDKFMPSSRSVAFAKSLWQKAGGYPEWLDIGEDMYFNFRVVELGAARAFAPAAVVRWRLRPTLKATLRQYFRYAEGDGRAGMYPRRHALRFAAYAGGLLVAGPAVRRRSLLLGPTALGALRMLPAYRRAWRRLDPAEALIAVAALPALELLIDVAKMSGYLSGRLSPADKELLRRHAG
jgi:glycosyltransferase involved in cell wall biosynthesis